MTNKIIVGTRDIYRELDYLHFLHEFNDIIPSLTLDGMLKILDDYEKE